MRSLSLPFSDCGLTQAEFYEIFEFLLYRGFGLMSEFSCWLLWHENGLVFAINKTCYFLLLVREYCSGASPQSGRGLGQSPINPPCEL